MCELIGHLQAKNPDDRYGSAKEVSDLLAQCLAAVQAGHQPRIPAPAAVATALRPAVTSSPQVPQRTWRRPLAHIAITALVRQELVTVTRYGRTTVRLSLESAPVIATSTGEPSSARLAEERELASGEPIDLIQLFEPARDFLDDRLKLQDGKLITPQFRARPGAIGMIPYHPVPAEYDIQLQLQRTSNSGAAFNVGVLVDGRQVTVGMDCGIGEKVWGLDFLDGRPGHHYTISCNQ